MQAREEAEALYQALVEGALDAMLVVDRQTRRFVLANVAAERLLGYSRAELRSLGPRDLTPPEDLEAFDLAVAQLQAAGYWRGECRVRRKDGETLAVEVAASAVRIGQRLSYQGLLRDLSERKRLEAEQEGLLARRAAQLRVARRLVAEPDAHSVLSALLEEALVLAGADSGAVYRFAEAERRLVLVQRTLVPAGLAEAMAAFDLDHSLSGQALRAGRPVILGDYRTHSHAVPAMVQFGVRAVLVVPLRAERRPLGVLAVVSRQPEKRFTAQDAEALETLAGIAAAALVGLERARLEGALLAIRTAAHHMNNQLALTIGYAELLATDPRLPAELREMAQEAQRGAEQAAETLARLQRMVRLEEAAAPLGLGGQSVFDLERSSAPPEG